MRTKILFHLALVGWSVHGSGGLAAASVTVSDCDETSLRAALAESSDVSIGCNGTIELTSPIVISNEVTLFVRDGSRLSGRGANRIFEIEPGGHLRASYLILTDGRDTRGGAILNRGSLTMNQCQLMNNRAVGTNGVSGPGGAGLGGAIANEGELSLKYCLFSNNNARGGRGGRSPDGIINFPGGTGDGGAIWTTNVANLEGVEFTANIAEGGESAVAVSGGGFFGIGSTGRGGAISVAGGHLLAFYSTFRQNSTKGADVNGGKYGVPGGAALGGAVHSQAALELKWCTFEGNTASGGVSFVQSGFGGAAQGGAVGCEAGPAIIADCRIAANRALAGSDWANAYGGGLYLAGTSVIEHTSIETNLALGGRAGRAHPANVKAGNGLGGGVYNAGDLTVRSSSWVANRARGGSGIDGCLGCSPPPVNSYLDGGDGEGGGLFNVGTWRATNSTFAANEVIPGDAYITGNGGGGQPGRAAGSAVAVETNGTGQLNFVTISGNAGPAASLRIRGSLGLRNTIVGPTVGSSNCWGVLMDEGHNISSDDSAHLDGPGSVNGMDPLLDSLQPFNPGFGFWPKVGSPVVDAGECDGTTDLDQRGERRSQGFRCDMGAVESGYYSLHTLDEDSLRTALAEQPLLTFGRSGTILLSAPLVISNTIGLSGAGQKVTLSGNNAHRIFEVLPGGALGLDNLTLRDGSAIEGGAIINDGNAWLERIDFVDNHARPDENIASPNGVRGGAIFNRGSLSTTNCVFAGNDARHGAALLGMGGVAYGGAFYNATNGIAGIYNTRFTRNQAVGSGGGATGIFQGAPGFPGAGGAVFNEGSLLLLHAEISENLAAGGDGGSLAGNGAGASGGAGGAASGGGVFNAGIAGLHRSAVHANTVHGGAGRAGVEGAAPPGFPAGQGGPGGAGGAGGDAEGAGVFNRGQLFLLDSSLTANVGMGGSGGLGGLGGVGSGFGGRGGDGGAALGGGLRSSAGTVSGTNVTIAANDVTGGGGGNGGNGRPNLVNGSPGADGGSGGSAGFAAGAGFHKSGAGDDELAWFTIAANRAFAGTGGAGGLAACGRLSCGVNGQNGAAPGALGHAFLVEPSSGAVHARASIVASPLSPAANGLVLDDGDNLCSDSSVVFTRPTSRSGLDPMLGPLEREYIREVFTYRLSPLPGSPAVDAVSGTAPPPADQRGVPRPQRSRSDVGAVEATFLALEYTPSDVEHTTRGTVEVRYAGIPGLSYTLEASGDLNGPWGAIQTMTASDSGVVQYPTQLLLPFKQFFRVRHSDQ